MLLTRVLTAVVVIPIYLPILIYAGALVNGLLFTVAVSIGLMEYFSMAFPKDSHAKRFGVVIGTMLFFTWMIGITFEAPHMLYAMSLVLAFIAMFFYFLFNPGDMTTIASRTAIAILGVIYVDLLLIHFVAIYNLQEGWRYVILFLAIIWLTDTGAMFAGKAFGKHKFYELISPNKTWEGSIGGALLSLSGAFLFDYLLSTNLAVWQIIITSLVVGYVGQLGDLCESLLKRSFGIKDSGTIIPGHGGILDRIDAVMFGAPIMYYFLIFVIL